MQEVFSGAKWIWCRKDPGKNEYAEFVTEFEVRENVCGYILNICSDTDYTVWINGKFVNCGQYNDFPECKVYDSLPLDAYVVRGKNRLCVIAYSHNEPTQWYVVGKPSVIFEVCKGEKTVCVSNRDVRSRLSCAYRSGDTYKITGQLGYSFRYDADREDRWNYLDAEFVSFANSVELERDCRFMPRGISKLEILPQVPARIVSQGVFVYPDGMPNVAEAMQQAYLSHRELKMLTPFDFKVNLPQEKGIRFHAEKSGVYVILDLEQEQCGFFHIRIKTDTPVHVDVGFGEHLDDLRVRTSISGRCFAFELTTRCGITDFTAYMRRIGCRYLQLFVHATDFTLYECSILPAVYPLKVREKKISDFLRRKIYETGVRTLRLCMHQHYEDCPWREQALYTFDSRIQMLCGYTAFGEYAMARDNLLLFSQALREDGHLELCAPCRMPLTIPMFSLTYLLQVKEYTQYSKDNSLAEIVYPVCEKILYTFIEKIDKIMGLLPAFRERQYWNFYEWREGLDGMPLDRDYELQERYDAILNAFLVMAIDSFIFLRLKKGLRENEELIRVKKKLVKRLNEVFYDAEKGIYFNYFADGKRSLYSEFANSVLLYAGVVPEECQLSLAEKLLKNEGMIPSTLSALIFEYDAVLSRFPDKLGEVLRQIDEIWGSMLSKGATTFWETQSGADDFYFAGSLCHGWSALPVHIYNTYGVRTYRKTGKDL